MGKRGPKPSGKVKICWSDNFAYALGLIASDGCLSKDGRHIDLTSVEIDQLENFKKALNIPNVPIGIKKSVIVKGYRVQFSDVLFYEFLLSIGLTPNKSLTLGEVKIPDEYFFDFMRGVFDGDGCSYSYFDKRWKNSYMFYTSFGSASKKFIEWIHISLQKKLHTKGSLTVSQGKKNPFYQLKLAKADTRKLFKEMYRSKDSIYLERKYLKLKQSLAMMT